VQSKYKFDISELIKARQEIEKWKKSNSDAFSVVNAKMQRYGEVSSISMKKAQRAIKKTGDEAEFSGKKINRMGMRMQQAGYQIGDFAVQVQSGTNVMVALGQQGAQLLGIFGAGGAIAGAALAIGTALIAPLMRGEKAAKELTDRIKELKREVMESQVGRSLPKELEETYNEQDALYIKILSAENDLLAATKARKAQEGKIRENSSLMIELKAAETAAQKELNKLTEKRAANFKIINDYNKALLEKQKEIFKVENSSLEAQNTLLQLKLQFGEDSLAVREMERQIARDEYAQQVKSLNINDDMKKQLIEQNDYYLYQLGLLEDINRAKEYQAEIDKRFADETLLMDMPVKQAPQKGKKKTAKPKDPLESLMNRLELEKELLGVNQDRAAVMRALGESRGNYDEKSINAAIALQAEIRKQNELLDKQQELYDTIGGHLEDAMMSFMDHTKSAEEKFKEFANAVIQDLYRILVVQELVNAAKTAMGGGSFLGSLFGGFMANGGSVSSDKAYIVGEKGPELFVPSSNGTIVPNDKMGGNGVTVVQNINVSTGVQQTVRSEIRQMMPQIAESAKAAVLDSKRRGGNYGRALA
jgi:hypothetical protein